MVSADDGIDSQVVDFASFFEGRIDAWGDIQGKCIKEPVTLANYRSHREGKESLGIYLVKDGNVVSFSAIDADTTDINVPMRLREALLDVNITSYIALSKRQRFHLYTFYIEPVPAAKIREVYRRILHRLEMDWEIFPKQDALSADHPFGNYLNLPYFGDTRPFIAFDKDGKSWKVPLDYFLEHVKLVSEEHLNRILSQLPPTPKREVSPSWVVNLLRNPLKFGQRDASVTRVAGYLHSKGLPQPVTLAIIGNVPMEKGEHAFTPDDIKKCVASVYQYPEKEEKSLELVSLPTLLTAKEDNPGDLVSGIVPKAGVCIVGGEPGTGKTWWMLTLARDVAKGTTFLGKFATISGPVLVIDEESGKYRLQNRALKLGFTEGLPISFSIMKVLNLSDPDWEEPLRQAIESMKPVLVVMDSLVRLHRGDENLAAEMAKLFATLTKLREEFGCAFVITHHLRKRAQQAKLNTLEQRLRGSSDIAAYADSILGLERVDDRLILRQLKNRDGEFIKPLALGIDDIADDRTEIIVLTEVDEEADKRKEARNIVRKALKEGGKLREDLVILAKGEGISERTLVDALKSLIDAGEIVRNMEGHKSIYRIKETTQPRNDL